MLNLADKDADRARKLCTFLLPPLSVIAVIAVIKWMKRFVFICLSPLIKQDNLIVVVVLFISPGKSKVAMAFYRLCSGSHCMLLYRGIWTTLKEKQSTKQRDILLHPINKRIV
jgi:hypothetical protein